MVIFISEDIEILKNKLAEKDDKLKNQASELNHLTNEVIPELKKENKQLKALKIELTEALETSTKKYFDQLEINADLSESVAKKGAGLQLAKVRLAEIEKLVGELESQRVEEQEKREEAELKAEESLSDEDKSQINVLNDKIDELNKELADKDKLISNKEKEISKKQSQLKNKDSELNDLKDNLIPKLKAEAADLNKQLKNAKEESEKEMAGVGGKIAKLEAEIKDLNAKLDNKKRDYDKLSTAMNAKDKTINSLKNRNKQLSEELKEESGKGFFSRLKGR